MLFFFTAVLVAILSITEASLAETSDEGNLNIESSLRHPRYVLIPKHNDKKNVISNFNDLKGSNCDNENDYAVRHYDHADKSVSLEKPKYASDFKRENEEDDESDDLEDDIVSDRADSTKLTRSADPYFYENNSSDNCEDNKCKNGNGDQGRRNDFMDLTGSGKKTTNIALKAAQEAKAAEEAQESAGKEASKQAKIQLAEKAIQAAKAALAALSAKQTIVDELERELREGEMVVQDLGSSIQQSESNANAALRAYQQAQAQLKMLTELVQVAQSTVGFAEQAAQGSQQELNEKTQLLEAAKNRVEKLLRELKAARVDFGNTKKEAYKASMAAKEARQNVARVRRNEATE